MYHRRKAELHAIPILLGPAGPGIFAVAAVTLANGADNLVVYVPAFATTGTGALLVYLAPFLVPVAVWCAAGYRAPAVRWSPGRCPAGGTSCCPWS